MPTTHMRLATRGSGEILIPMEPLSTSRIIGVVTMLAVLLVLSWIIVALRFYTRYFYNRIGYDDWFMLVTLLFYTIYNASVMSMELLDINVIQMPGSVMDTLTNLLLTCESFYIWGMITFKISLGFFFWRILKDKWQHNLLIGIICINFMIGFAYFFFTVFQCGVPGHGGSYWLKKITDQCLSRKAVIGISFPHAIINALTDVVLCAMPITLVWQARLSRREKLTVSGILTLAAVGSIASLARLGFVASTATATLDFWVKVEPLGIVSGIELGLGIMSASLATLRPLLRRIRGHVRAYKSRSTSRSRPSKSDPEKGEEKDLTNATTLIDDSRNTNRTHNNVNFLLSATNANDTFDEKEPFQFFTTDTNSPLKTNAEDNDQPEHRSLSPIFVPQLQRPQEMLQHQIPDVSDENRRSKFWHIPRTQSSQRPSSMVATDFASQLETNASSAERLPTEPPPHDPEPNEPRAIPLQPGYRKWVIR